MEVTGVFETGMYEYDDRYIVVSLATAVTGSGCASAGNCAYVSVSWLPLGVTVVSGEPHAKSSAVAPHKARLNTRREQPLIALL